MTEEAVELYQVAGGEQEKADALVRHVFAKPAGEPFQEAGGVAVTLLSYRHAAGFDPDPCEATEVARVLARPLGEVRRRYEAKMECGL